VGESRIFTLASRRVLLYASPGCGGTVALGWVNGKSGWIDIVGRAKLFRTWLAAGVLALSSGRAAAHTLPISYLRLVPDADYLHLELVFNPFELTFVPEADENKDGELNLAELAAHGQLVADRVVSAIKLSAGGATLRPETAGMDPDLNGHHVRLRAHYKVDARRLPLTVESDLPALTSSSHLTQITYVNDGHQQLAQLDPHSRKATFQPPADQKPTATPARPHRRAALGLVIMVATVFLVVLGAALLWVLRKQRIQ
jgi:hypothetical protein